LPGQEEENPEFFKKYNLAIICLRPSKLKNLIEKLLDNDGEKLKMIKEAQKKFRNPDTAKEIVDFIMNVKKKKPSEFSLMQRNRRKLRYLGIKALNKLK